MSNYPHQVGTWTLIAPSGKEWRSDSPMRCVALESRERIPADVALARVMAVVDEPDPESSALRSLAQTLVDALGDARPVAYEADSYRYPTVLKMIDTALSTAAEMGIKPGGE